MKHILLATALMLASFQAAAKHHVKISDAKIFAPLKGTPATAGYGVFENTTNKDIKLTIESAAPFKAVELHETTEKDGKMAMQKVDVLVVPAKGKLELKPGGHHIMLFEPNREVKNNETIKVVFKEDGKTTEYSFKVVPRVEATEEHHHHH